MWAAISVPTASSCARTSGGTRHDHRRQDLQSGPDVHGDDRLDGHPRGRLERQDPPKTAIPAAAADDDDRWEVERQRARGAEHVHQRGVEPARAEEEELTGVEVDDGYRQRSAELVEPPGWDQRLDRSAERSRPEECPGEQPEHRRQRIAHDP